MQFTAKRTDLDALKTKTRDFEQAVEFNETYNTTRIGLNCWWRGVTGSNSISGNNCSFFEARKRRRRKKNRSDFFFFFFFLRETGNDTRLLACKSTQKYMCTLSTLKKSSKSIICRFVRWSDRGKCAGTTRQKLRGTEFSFSNHRTYPPP